VSSFFDLSPAERTALITGELHQHPDGEKFSVGIFRHTWGREDLFIEPKNTRDNPFKFYVWETGPKLQEKLTIAAEALRMVERSGKATKIDYRVCCPLAKREHCVCEIRYSCPLHGGGCIGSHD
jgi:hypothetical protein